ncbi:MAG: hypothetical protein RMA76_44390 [Deltaproteobacteria bacterium]|jgi:hypothetical protein
MRRLALALLLTLVSATANAAEDELVLAVEPGWALLTTDPVEQHGGGGGLSAWLGLNDELWLALSAGASAVPARDPLPSAVLYEAFGGIVAALDVFSTIPFLEAQAGFVATKDAVSPTIRFGVGADYFITRTITVGAVVRVRPVDEAIGGTLVSAGARLALRLEL